MRFLSIDLETTGLIPSEHQILQIGVVIGDFRTVNLDDLPAWECLIAHEEIHGHPKALAMNAALIEKIANRNNYPNDLFFPTCEAAYRSLFGWLESHDWPIKAGKARGTVAGKNAGGFEMPFLYAPQNDGEVWDELFQLRHRVFDPGSLFFKHTDQELPDLKTCLKRAGVEKAVEHTAVADALDVIRLLRAHYGMEPEELFFTCNRCGKPTVSAPDPPGLAWCEECCTDHEYEYDRDRRGRFCNRCDAKDEDYGRD